MHTRNTGQLPANLTDNFTKKSFQFQSEMNGVFTTEFVSPKINAIQNNGASPTPQSVVSNNTFSRLYHEAAEKTKRKQF